jgi:Amidohydrolase family
MSFARIFDEVEVDGRPARVRVEDGLVTHVVPLGRRLPDAHEVVAGAGGALLPGLHDHHLHVLALAARQAAVPCGPGDVDDLETLRTALNGTSGDGWVHGAGYHESVAGRLDRHELDRLVPDRPVCLQHRNEDLTLLNSRAVALVDELLSDSDDVERDGSGTPTGRLHRYDERLRTLVPDPAVDLTRLGRQLVGLGLTGVTDATPELDDHSVALLSEAAHSRALPRVTALGLSHTTGLPSGLVAGPWRLPLHEDNLPTARELLDLISATHASGRPVSIPVGGDASLALLVSVLDRAGRMPGDRVDLAPDVRVPQPMALRGLAVITHPGADDIQAHRFRTLLEAGIRVVASSDAPYGEPDPWHLIAGRARLGSSRGHGPSPLALVDLTLAGYLSPAALPGDDPRRVRPGAREDLLLLDAPLDEVLARLAAGRSDNPVVAAFEGAPATGDSSAAAPEDLRQRLG